MWSPGDGMATALMTYCSYGYLLTTKTRSVNTPAASTNWTLWLSSGPEGDNMKVGEGYSTGWYLRVLGGMSSGGSDQGIWYNA